MLGRELWVVNKSKDTLMELVAGQDWFMRSCFRSGLKGRELFRKKAHCAPVWIALAVSFLSVKIILFKEKQKEKKEIPQKKL